MNNATLDFELEIPKRVMGLTPVKGVDYWTEEDRQEIADLIQETVEQAAIDGVDLTNYYTKENIDEKVQEIDENIASVRAAIPSIEDINNTIDNEITLVKNDLATVEESIPKVEDFEKLIPSLEGYATEGYVAQEIGKIPKEDLSQFALKSEIPSIAGLATETFVEQKIAEAELGGEDVDLTGFYTKTEVDSKIDEVEDKIDIKANEIKTEVESAGYLKEENLNDIKDRIQTLEEKEDADTVYDDTAVKADIEVNKTDIAAIKEALTNLPSGGEAIPELPFYEDENGVKRLDYTATSQLPEGLYRASEEIWFDRYETGAFDDPENHTHMEDFLVGEEVIKGYYILNAIGINDDDINFYLDDINYSVTWGFNKTENFEGCTDIFSNVPYGEGLTEDGMGAFIVDVDFLNDKIAEFIVENDIGGGEPQEPVDLENYYTKEEIDDLLSNLPTGDTPNGMGVKF